MKTIKIVIAAVVTALMFIPAMALASEVVADESGLISAIVSALPALISMMPAWVGALIGVLYAVAHAVALLPEKVTAKWPMWLKSLINLLAANYGKAKNANG